MTRDVLVLGGGITGCAVAREAALRGMRVLLAEAEDLAAGTSSASTKLLHGGLRYLEYGWLSMVRESLREREVTARLAPHLARPLPLVVPAWDGRRPGRLALRTAVGLYDLLAGPHPLARGRLLSTARTHALLPDLTTEGLRGGVAFADRQTDDARLTVEIARAAAALGAEIRVGLRAVALLERRGKVAGATLEDGITGERTEVLSRFVVNATGPWADRLRALAGLNEPVLAPSRGTHVVLHRPMPDPGVMLLGERRGRRTFVLPWRGRTLVGTTDLPERGAPDAVAPTGEEVRSLLAEIAAHFPRWRTGPESVLSAFAGVRPLLRSAAHATLDAPRDHAVLEERGLFTLVGGKLTTWRAMAADLLDRMAGPAPPAVARASLTRVVAEGPVAGLPPHLAAHYGARGQAVLARAASDRDAAAPLDGEGPEIAAEVDVAVEEEFARRLTDVLLRRLPLAQDPRRCRSLAPMVAARMRTLLGWSARRESEEIATLESRLHRDEAWRA
ncbi:MAG TPA: glycerol-3-phosphate dehydrogenase/oxidase [Candidatus Polarisedimenticolaceae bacterium]|nr:glycerol-3-phosphate dehydrogenase/oxidase [Candidatus Polarisedimenticolaceae bacterium]